MAIVYETPFDFQSKMENEVTVEDPEGNSIIYRAEAYRLWFGNDSIRGTARLVKYKLAKKTKKSFLWWRPKKEWEFTTNKKILPFFLFQGKINNERDFGYRSDLVGLAIERGIALSDELLDLAFGPIDKKIMEIYLIIVNKKNNQ